MFKRLDGDNAVVEKGGVWKPADVYEMDGMLFVKAQGGFVRVKGDGSTSVPGLTLRWLAREKPLFADKWNRLCVNYAPGRKKVTLDYDPERLETIMTVTPQIEGPKT